MANRPPARVLIEDKMAGPCSLNTSETDLLIVGAGPFGLSLAAYAQDLGIDYTIAGKPMGFWQSNMPRDMFLRSNCDWHLDPMGTDTIDAYLRTLGKARPDVEPLSLVFFLEYAAWFQTQKGIRSLDVLVEALTKNGGLFSATLTDGRQVNARSVVLALGFGNFDNRPPAAGALFPAERCHHTSELGDPSEFRGQRVLIVGGRQSAFESAALLQEAGAAEIYLTYCHATPEFTASDWSWVQALVNSMVSDPGWFRRLDDQERETLVKRFWVEGRQKLEPWLAPRIEVSNVRLFPGTKLLGCDQGEDVMRVRLASGQMLGVDEVVFATGFKMDLDWVPFLGTGLRPGVETRNGFPVLDDHFQTSVEGLYMTSLAATQDFGPFFGFTVSVGASARIIGDDLRARLVETDP